MLAIFYRLHAVLRKGLVMYLYTNKSISDTAIKVASLQAGAFFNMDTLQRSIQRFTDTIKTTDDHEEACIIGMS